MRLIILTSLLLILAAVVNVSAMAEPRLAVIVIVDQMPARFLNEFADDFESGFALLRNEGAVFTDAFHDHALTETAPGHATILSGTYPSRHGVVSNEIWDHEAQALRSIVLDGREAMVGGVRLSGRSPHRLMRSSLGDWLKEADPRSKVFGVSLKDRSAVFAAGKQADGAYWYDERAGNFVTSTYYRQALDPWVVEFNAAARVDRYFGRAWNPSFADGHVRRNHAPQVPATFSDFPHVLTGDSATPDRRFYARFRLTPFADLLTLEFVEALIEAEGLGVDASPDLLVVGLSAADYIGHRYGPWSEEVHEHYAKLDAYLGDFLAFLDERIGRDRYVLTLTSDHGVMPIPEQMSRYGLNASRVSSDELLVQLAPVVAGAAERGVIPSMPMLGYNSGVIFDFGDAVVSESRLAELADLVETALEKYGFVGAAYTPSELAQSKPGRDPWLSRYQHNYYPGRSPTIMVRAEPNYLITDEKRGATHGSPYDYDSRVPLIFFGAGMAQGEHGESIVTVDIAPTLAAVLGIDAPSDLDGKDRSAALRRPD